MPEESENTFFNQEDENKERGNWTGKLDFLLSAIGYAVGLGNVWRFPYICYDNGGAAFLIPYVIMLTFAGLPLFFMEMSLGQFSSEGPISVWKIAPLFKGLGYAMCLISGLVCIYYNMIIAYTLFYLFASFTSKLPWSECQEGWVEMYNCANRTGISDERIREINGWCNTLRKNETFNWTSIYDNYTGHCETVAATQIYWDRVVLDRSDSLNEGGDEFRWQLVLCLVLAWAVIFGCLCKGIKSSGKVVYVTATFPYIVLIILCIRNAILPGALDGVKFYIIPKADKLLDPKVWYSAAVQIFYSLGVAFGGLETMASYNRFKNNIHRDALIVAICNCGTSVFAGFVIFSIIGYMGFRTGQDVESVVSSGPGLAFVAYPEGLSLMPIAPLWAILFFLMLFTLGLDSQFAMMETVISAFVDEFPVLQKGKNKIWFTGILIIVLFLLGVPQCARNGVFIMNLFDWYSAGFSLLAVSFLECIAVSWIYGFERFREDVAMMVGFKPNYYWVINWVAITPLILVAIICFMGWQYTPASYGDYVYEPIYQGIGWLMVVAALFLIVALGLIEYCKAHGFIETMGKVLKPKRDWGPALPQFRQGRYKPEDLEFVKGNIDSNGETNMAYEATKI